MIKHAFVYLFSSIINKLTPFFLLPILTRYLSPADYGLISLYQVAVTFAVAVCGFGLQLNIAKAYPVMKAEEFGRFTFSVFILLCTSSLVVFIISVLGGMVRQEWFSIGNIWWMSVPVLAFATMVTLFNQTILRSSGSPWVYGAFEVSSTLANLGLSILFVIVMAWGWHGRAAGILFANFVTSIIAILFMKNRHWIIPSIDKVQIKKILIFSLPLMPYTISSAVIGVSDRFFLEGMVGKEELGIYSVGYSFGMVIMLITDAFAKSWTPWFLRTVNQQGENPRRKIVLITYLFLLTMLVGVPIYIYMAKEIVPYVVGNKFYAATEYIAVISYSYLFFGIYQIFFPYLVATGSTRALGVIGPVGAASNLLLNFVLIKACGAIGAAWSTLIAYFIVSLLVMLIAIRKIKMPWSKVLLFRCQLKEN